MNERKTEITTVYMTENMYFTVDNYCMTLYQIKPEIKTHFEHGNFTSHESMIKKASRIIMSDSKKKMIMSAYLEELRTIQNELLTKLKNV